MEWRREPILATIEYRVRGSTDRSLVDEHILISPDVISAWMDT
jgi:hypothetical protein